MNTLMRSLGTDKLSKAELEKMENNASHANINGYIKDYRVARLGRLELNSIYKISSWIGNAPAGYELVGRNASFASGTVWQREVSSVTHGDGEILVKFTDTREKGFIIAAKILHGDALPDIMAGDELKMRIFGLAESLAASEPLAGDSEPDMLLLPGQLIDKDEDEAKTFVFGKILSVQENIAPTGLSPALAITVQTPGAPLAVICLEKAISEEARRLLAPGNMARAMLTLYGDVAVGEYGSGIVFTLENNLRLLAACSGAHDFSRARQIFANNCLYYANGEFRAQGVDEIIKALDKVKQRIVEQKIDLKIVYGRATFCKDARGMPQDEKCLVFYKEDKTSVFLMFANLEEDGRIGKLWTAYKLDDLESLIISPNLQNWREGVGDDVFQSGLGDETDKEEEPDVRESQDAGDSAGFYANPALAARVHGDPSTFYGEPDEDYMGLLAAIAPDMNFKKLREMAKKALFARRAPLLDPEHAACYGLYPDALSLLAVQFALIEDGKGRLEGHYAYPFMRGYEQEMEVLARFDLEPALCGYVAVAFEEQILNCFALSYCLQASRLKPGATVKIELSGLAMAIRKAAETSFKIDAGPLYEMDLAHFLSNNPDKTPTDFPGAVVSMGSAIMRFPTDDTCFFEISAPVLKVEELTFEGRKFARLLMPIIQGEENALAWIYASMEDLGDFRPKAGDRAECVAWLCALAK